MPKTETKTTLFDKVQNVVHHYPSLYNIVDEIYVLQKHHYSKTEKKMNRDEKIGQ
jgi:hypothetical protein